MATYAGDQISWAWESQKFGNRYERIKIECVDLQRSVTTDTPPTVKIFKAGLATACAAPVFPSDRETLATIKPVLAGEVRVRVEGTVDASAKAHIIVYEVTVGTKEELKRKQ